MLTRSTQKGKTIAIHAKSVMTNSSIRPSAKPTSDTQRARTAVRSPIMEVTNIKMAAIFMPKVFSERVGHRSTDCISFAVCGETAWGSEGFQQSSGNGNGGEQHGDEQQSAAQKYRCEEPIFEQADAVAQHSHEPEERDPREWNQVQSDADPIPVGWIGKPDTGVLWVGRDSESDEYQAGDIKR